MSSIAEEHKKKSLGKIIGCGCTVLFLAVVAIIAAVVLGVFGLLKKSTPYIDSIAAVKANPAAVEALGEPIESGFLVTGNISINNDTGNADIIVPVSGPKANGKIHVEGTKEAGVWSYPVWELRVEDVPEAIPLGN